MKDSFGPEAREDVPRKYKLDDGFGLNMVLTFIFDPGGSYWHSVGCDSINSERMNDEAVVVRYEYGAGEISSKHGSVKVFHWDKYVGGSESITVRYPFMEQSKFWNALLFAVSTDMQILSFIWDHDIVTIVIGKKNCALCDFWADELTSAAFQLCVPDPCSLHQTGYATRHSLEPRKINGKAIMIVFYPGGILVCYNGCDPFEHHKSCHSCKCNGKQNDYDCLFDKLNVDLAYNQAMIVIDVILLVLHVIVGLTREENGSHRSINSLILIDVGIHVIQEFGGPFGLVIIRKLHGILVTNQVQILEPFKALIAVVLQTSRLLLIVLVYGSYILIVLPRKSIWNIMKQLAAEFLLPLVALQPSGCLQLVEAKDATHLNIEPRIGLYNALQVQILATFATVKSWKGSGNN